MPQRPRGEIPLGKSLYNRMIIHDFLQYNKRGSLGSPAWDLLFYRDLSFFYDLVDDPVANGFFGGHEIVPIRIPEDFLDIPSGMVS